MAAHKNHQQKKYKKLRAVTLWLHDQKCFICKKPFETLECHHINKDSTDHRLTNLIPVCPADHLYLGKMASFREFTKEEIKQLIYAAAERL